MQSKTLRERIADALREAIIRGELSPGARLQEVEIAKSYQTSRTPVREAFRQLESEGFVRIRSRRGAVVAPITERDIRDFYELKSVLEGYAARRSISRMSDSDINKMDDLNKRLKTAYEQGNVGEMIPVHNEFHEIFVRACGNERLAELVRSLVNQFQRFRIALSHTDAVEDSIREHDEIISAFRARDEERACNLVQGNAAQGAERLIAKLKHVEGFESEARANKEGRPRSVSSEVRL